MMSDAPVTYQPTDRLQRFVVIDPSIKSLLGHHFTYAVSVLKAAKGIGWYSAVGIHRLASSDARENLAQEVDYLFDGFRHEHWPRPQEFRLLQRLAIPVDWLFQVAAWLAPEQWGPRLQRWRSPRVWAERPLTQVAEVLAGVVVTPTAIVAVILECILPPAISPRRLYWSLLRLCKRMHYGWQHRWMTYFKRRHFVEDLARFHNAFGFRSNDVLFIPTLSLDELYGLAEWLPRCPVGGVSWHLVFRYNIFSGPESDYPAQLKAAQSWKSALVHLGCRARGHHLHFWTDTDELTRQFRLLDAGKFETLPIPHTHRVRKSKQTGRQQRVAVYLGDARCEKGFDLLPAVVKQARLAGLPPDLLLFRLQGNLQANGEAAAAAALEQLSQLAGVELVGGLLSTYKYEELLLSGDIVLLLYSPDVYAARSSGILAEALAAGIPVLVRYGTWLSAQVQPAIAAYWQTLVEAACCRTAQELPVGPDFLSGDVTGCAPAAVRFAFSSEDHGLLFETEHRCQLPGLCVEYRLEWVDAAGQIVEEDKILLGPLRPSEPIQHLHMIPADAAQVRVSWTRPETAAQACFESSHWSVCRWPPACRGSVPRSAVGVICSSTQNAGNDLAEIVRHFEHYRQTAQEMAAAYLGKHNPAALLDALRSRK